MIKSSINLLQPELLPKKPWLTLSTVISIWLLALLVMLAGAGYSHFQRSDTATELVQLNQQNESYNAQLETLKTQQSSAQADSVLTTELATLKALTRNKRYFHGHLTDTEYTYIGGFAAAMKELSALHSAQISLHHIRIHEDQFYFAGKARQANAVPNWLANFEQSQVLSGQVFQQLSMIEGEDKLIAFQVSSTDNLVEESE
ncbi:hypothetical protein DXX93_17450 [Thalassotalea euphylliae]|uniref:MSHA biogenesis protein MshI n=1 Tax=Thalassotalea euphylliae TaxID=1655234 RepID=A0A3E0TUW9_9GAMM|nr:PilN domain-containing protein [Thalassotalea euphylliae]REL28173.1 hypothetical protein DXX93_17450 [Thalassotalea euphylliae]